MEHDITAFWSDIKKYEEALVNDPASYCFVPLADLYRRMGLLDDAIHVAKKGCDLHPDYVGGYMALGRAYFEKGMKPESKEALEKVVSSAPDNLMARRILSQIYVEVGETAAAAENLLFILSQNPDDKESQILLNSLKSYGYDDRNSASSGTAREEEGSFDLRPFELSLEDDEIIEDAELVEEFDDE
jgi:tetratricopeptide (TPR) repeat protein